MTDTKQCTKCNETKELTEFYKRKSHKDGLTYWCKGCFRARQLAKSDDIRKYDKAYRQKNAKKIARRMKSYQAENRQARTAYQIEYNQRRVAVDREYRLICRMRSRMRNALNGTLKHSPTLELLGCTVEHFRFHLEQQFTEGMTWDNYGEWHMDHIQPCASFDQTDPEQQKICWHYTNYQPLWAEDNLRKSDTIINEHQTKLL